MVVPRACHASVQSSADLYQKAVRKSCWTWASPPFPEGIVLLSFSAVVCKVVASVNASVPSSRSSLSLTPAFRMYKAEQAQTRRIRLVNSGVRLFAGVAHHPSYWVLN